MTLRYSQFYCTVQIDHVKRIKTKNIKQHHKRDFMVLWFVPFLYTHREIRLKRMRVFEYRLLCVHSPINRIVQTRGHIGTATIYCNRRSKYRVNLFFQFANIVNGDKFLITLEIIITYSFVNVLHVKTFSVAQIFIKERKRNKKLSFNKKVHIIAREQN